MTNTETGEQAKGFMRLTAIIAPHGPIPISKSSWWSGIRDGRYPKPVRIGPRISVWRTQDIVDLISKIERGNA